MARTKDWTLDSIEAELVEVQSTVVRDSDNAKVPVTYYELPTDTAKRRDILTRFIEDDAACDMMASLFDAKVKQAPVSAAKRGIDDTTARAEALLKVLKTSKDASEKAKAKAELAKLYASDAA